MDAEVHTDASSSAEVVDSDLIEDKLPKLSATTISICRRHVMQQAVQALGLSMHETTTYDNESDEILTSIRIDIPPHIRLKANILVIDGVHSVELKHCKRELLQASSWGQVFEQHASQLQFKLSAMINDRTLVLPISEDQAGVNLMKSNTDTQGCIAERVLASSIPAQSSLSKNSAMDKEKTPVLHLLAPSSPTQSSMSTDYAIDKGKTPILHLLTPSGPAQTEEMMNTKKCADGHFFASSSPAQMPQNILKEDTLSGIPFVALPNNAELPPFVFRFNRSLPFGKRRRPDPVLVPEPPLAAFNRKKCKWIVDSRRPLSQAVAVPSLGSSLKDMSAAVTDYSDGTTYVSPIHIDHTLATLSTPPSVSRPVSLSKDVDPLYSKVRKSLFQATVDTNKATDLGDKLLGNTGDAVNRMRKRHRSP